MTAETFTPSNQLHRQGIDEAAASKHCGQKAEAREFAVAGNVPAKGKDCTNEKEGDDKPSKGFCDAKLSAHKNGSHSTTIECLFLALIFFNATFGIAFAGAYVLAYALFWLAFRWLKPEPNVSDQLTRNRMVLALAGILLSTPLPGPLVHYGLFPAEVDFGGVLVALITGTLCALADTAERESRA